MLNDLRGLVQLGSALAEAGLAKVKDTLTAVVTMGDPEMLTSVIRTEIDQVVGRMGFVREDELAALRRHVERLEAELRERPAAPAESVEPEAAAPKPVVKKRKRPTMDATS